MKPAFELKLELGSCNPARACFRVWIVFLFFFLIPTKRSNTLFVLVGVAAHHRAGGPVPRSTGATCWHFIPWCLQHKHSSLRFSSLCFPLVWPDSHAFHYRVHRRSEHTERQSIFLFSSWSKKKRFCLCAFQHARFCISGSSSVITAWCIVPGPFEGLLSIAMRSS